MDWWIVGYWYSGAIGTFLIYLVSIWLSGRLFSDKQKASQGIIVISAIIFCLVFGTATCGTLYQTRREEVPAVDMLIKNEHKSYDVGADVFGITWEKDYSLHTVRIRNMSNNKSIKELSLLLEFSAAVRYRGIASMSGARGVKQGKEIIGEMQVTGPLNKNKVPETKVMSMGFVNVFNPTVEELFPEGLVVFRVILNSNEPQEIFARIRYYYESGKKLKQALFKGRMGKDKTKARFPNLKEIDERR